MRQIKCPVCRTKCTKYGKTNAGAQRWYCKAAFTQKIDHNAKEFKEFLDWLISKNTQKEMPSGGRSFRRRTAKFWNLWPMPPKIEEARDVLFLDGIYLARKACILICCDEKNVLAWYLCRYEHARAWAALMSRIAEPKVVVSDGGTGFKKALKRVWPRTQHQRCVLSGQKIYNTQAKYFSGSRIIYTGKVFVENRDKRGSREMDKTIY